MAIDEATKLIEGHALARRTLDYIATSGMMKKGFTVRAILYLALQELECPTKFDP